MELGENLMSNEIGEVFGLDTGRLVAKFSHESESASFVKSYNSQQLSAKTNVQDVDVLVEALPALKEVIRISDRKHDAWDSAKNAIAAYEAKLPKAPSEQN